MVANGAREGHACLLALEIQEQLAQRPIAVLGQAVDLLNRVAVQASRTVKKGQEQLARGLRVGKRPVGSVPRYIQLFGQSGQAVSRGVGHQDAGQFEGVYRLIGQEQAALSEKTQVEADGVAHHRIVPQEGGQPFHDIGDGRSRIRLLLVDARQPPDAIGDGAVGPDQSGPAIQDLIVAELDGSHFNDGVVLGVKSCGFQIQGDVDAGHVGDYTLQGERLKMAAAGS